jgi:hypothetical protein
MAKGIDYFSQNYKRDFKDKDNPTAPEDRERKEEVVVRWHSYITEYSRALQLCGLPPSGIHKYMIEPWHYNNIVAACKWFDNYMRPELDELTAYVNQNTAEYWQRLANINKSHADIKKLDIYKRRVTRIWKARPRFGNDMGRVASKGY